MKKIEIICPTCETHYIVVTKEKEIINNCPFCGTFYLEDELNDDTTENEESQ